ncbi:hypothetical protein C1645_840091 [Glomus cerebriforme]|uniref:Uncharacterized protein n=1 Tax=Glomus cerebriforme TaxID=658196 RepID=A0A397S5U9_9GLOM|nr:hypothetical protein C1645_840091 [Glomus cerebriforme]
MANIFMKIGGFCKVEPDQITIIENSNSTQEDEMNVDQHKSYHEKEGKCEKTNIEYSAPITIIDDSNSIQEVERNFDQISSDSDLKEPSNNTSKCENVKDKFVLVVPDHQSHQQNKVSALLQITDSDDSNHSNHDSYYGNNGINYKNQRKHHINYKKQKSINKRRQINESSGNEDSVKPPQKRAGKPETLRI